MSVAGVVYVLLLGFIRPRGHTGAYTASASVIHGAKHSAESLHIHHQENYRHNMETDFLMISKLSAWRYYVLLYMVVVIFRLLR